MSEKPRNSLQEPFDVCLLSMPYPCLDQPSMALGLLKAALLGAGIRVKTFYPSLRFAEEIGLDAYIFIYESKQEFLAGEWTFAGVAFPDFHPDHDAYLDTVFSAPVSQGLMRRSHFSSDPRKAIWEVRQAASKFTERVAREVLEHNPKIVGCTSTFMQHCASLAVLRKIREINPDVVTMMGGANCEANMGVATRKCFPWVDFVVSGEADLLLPELCRKILSEGKKLPASELPYGVIGGGLSRMIFNAEVPRASVEDMDSTPVPEFDDYFEALNASPLREYISPGLAMETSRGCWWGKVHHCTFCGLNGGNMNFRSKSADRVFDELHTLSRVYGIRKFNIVDNILDLSYIENLLPRLASDEPFALFFETKANLKREQMKMIADAGIRRLQPGVESMHDEVLRLIDKGTTAIMNTRMLKWARELGIFIGWNFLWDVPGEKDEWYGEMAEWLPLIFHLQPPGVDRIQFHRFSPYHQRPESFGLSLTPFPHYSYVYPVAAADLKDLAYYFHFPERQSARKELEARPHLKNVIKIIAEWSNYWKQVEEPPVLRMREEDDCIRITDTRPCALSNAHVLEGLACRVYNACDNIRTINGIMKTLSEPRISQPSLKDVQEVLEELQEQKLLLHLKDQFLALALREVRRIPDTIEELPAGYTDVQRWQAAYAIETSG